MFSTFIIHFYQWRPCSFSSTGNYLTRHSGTVVYSNVPVIQMILKEAGIQFLVVESE